MKAPGKIALGVLFAGVLVLGVGVWRAARLAVTYPQFWQEQAARPVAPNALRLIALGDSTTQAIGASEPLRGFVGLIAAHVARQTGRPIHISNVSVGGATVGEMLRKQLPRVNVGAADLVVVSSANDLEQRVPLEQYRRELTALLAALPATRTVLSDLPLEPGRGPYQAVLEQVADVHGVARADFAQVFREKGRRLDIFSLLFPHLNDRGYGLWFEAFRSEVDRIVQG